MDILFHLWNFHHIFKSLKKKQIVIANVFPKLLTVKELARALSKKHCFRTFFESEDVKGSQTLVKFGWHDFCHFFHHPEKK